MGIEGLQASINRLWEPYVKAPASTVEGESKSKNLFLKVQEGGLTFTGRAEVPTGIRWLRSSWTEYNFDTNIQKMKSIIQQAHAQKEQLKPDDIQHLQELESVHNQLVARHAQKSVPGMIGRLLIRIGIFSQNHYDNAIQTAIASNRLNLQWTGIASTTVAEQASAPQSPTELARGIAAAVLQEAAPGAAEPVIDELAGVSGAVTDEDALVAVSGAGNVAHPLPRPSEPEDVMEDISAPIQAPIESEAVKKMQARIEALQKNIQQLKTNNEAQDKAKRELQSELDGWIQIFTVDKEAFCKNPTTSRAFGNMERRLQDVNRER